MAPRSSNRGVARARRPREIDPFEEFYVALNPEASTHARLIEALEDGFDYMLIGAHARNAYISDPRTTRDLDVVVAGDQFDSFVTRAAGIVARSRVKRREGFATIARHNTHFLDIADASALWLYAEALPDAKRLSVPGIGRARVPRKEHIVAMKLMAALSPTRRLEKSLQDRADVISVLREGIERPLLDPLLARIPGAPALLADLERGM